VTDPHTDQDPTFARTTVPPELSSVPAARRWLDERLSSAPDDVRLTAALLTSELVANAVLHGAGDVIVTLQRQPGAVRVEVADASPQLPEVKHYGEEAATGRGLRVLSALADTWGAGRRHHGKVVWFELGHAGAAGPATEAGPLDGPSAPAPSDGAGLVPMTLRGVPVPALVRAQAAYDELFREFRLVVEGDPAGTSHAILGRLMALVDKLGTRFQGFTAGAEEEWRRAVECGAEAVDLHFELPPDIGAICARYDELLDEADEFCRLGALMTLAATPEVRAVRKWLLQEFARQAAHEPPLPWPESSPARQLEAQTKEGKVDHVGPPL
jgi:anti-sigma regulatory factor (Ser/Thr protein kinase)